MDVDFPDLSLSPSLLDSPAIRARREHGRSYRNRTVQLLGHLRGELLKEIVPRLSRVAVLWNPANRFSQTTLVDQARGAARTLGLQLQVLEARRAEDIESAFTATSRERAGALLLLPDAMFILQRGRIADLAAKTHLPGTT